MPGDSEIRREIVRLVSRSCADARLNGSPLEPDEIRVIWRVIRDHARESVRSWNETIRGSERANPGRESPRTTINPPPNISGRPPNISGLGESLRASGYNVVDAAGAAPREFDCTPENPCPGCRLRGP